MRRRYCFHKRRRQPSFLTVPEVLRGPGRRHRTDFPIFPVASPTLSRQSIFPYDGQPLFGKIDIRRANYQDRLSRAGVGFRCVRALGVEI